jgi:methionyl-tRNA synthetase
MIEALKQTPVVASRCFEEYRFRDGLLEVMNLARAANKYFNDSEPWKTAKSNRDQCGTTINVSLQIARSLAVLMSPLIPDSCERIWRMLNLEGEAAKQRWDSAAELLIQTGHKLGTPEILFTKIEDDVIDQAIRDTTGVAQTTVQAAAKPVEEKVPITMEDFKKIELRVAKVIACEQVPKSEKLLKLQVEIGVERRQIVAGIAKHYKPDELVGKSVVVVYNLQPAKLMGQESRGMVLAASDDDGKLLVVSPAGEIASGAVVR